MLDTNESNPKVKMVASSLYLDALFERRTETNFRIVVPTQVVIHESKN